MTGGRGAAWLDVDAPDVEVRHGDELDSDRDGFASGVDVADVAVIDIEPAGELPHIRPSDPHERVLVLGQDDSGLWTWQTRTAPLAMRRSFVRAVVLRVGADLLRAGASGLVAAWEAAHRPPRLLQLTEGGFGEPRAIADWPAEPILVLLHGLASTSADAFAGLGVGLRHELLDRYDGRVLAFDHPTLSVEPDATARELAEVLPPGAELHVVAHSRGGLVARELAGITRAIFVGTPNDGTELADSANVVHLLDVLTNSLDWAPAAADLIFALATEVLVAGARALPGITSLATGSRYLRALNRRRVGDAVYQAIASDYEPGRGAGSLLRLSDRVSDAVFRAQPNDLLVPTDSVFRPNGAWNTPLEGLVLDSSEQTHHGSYFESADVTAFLRTELIGRSATRSATAKPVDAYRRRARRGRTRLTIRMVHGNFANVTTPVLVGHAAGLPLNGAEGALDRLLGGALLVRQTLGDYPGRVGDALVVPPKDGHRAGPSLGVVVGLGASGDLTPSGLSQATQAGCRALADHWLGVATDERALTAVLVGTTGRNGLAIDDSVTAIIDGVIEHNLRLSDAGLGESTITRLDLIDLYEEQAEAGARTIRHVEDYLTPDLARRAGIMPPVAKRRMTRGKGGRPGRPGNSYRAGKWERIDISCDASDERLMTMAFTPFGNRSAMRPFDHTVERRIVDPLVADMIGRNAAPAADLNLLYRLLFPSDFRYVLAGQDNIHLIVDQNSASYPWEMAAGRGAADDYEPLALRTGLLRQLRSDEGGPPPAGRHAPPGHRPRALVFGHPADSFTSDGAVFSALPGAITEAKRVRQLLDDHDYEVKGPVPATVAEGEEWKDLLRSILDGHYQIVHIAAHGVYDPDSPERSGVVLGGGKYLTAMTVRQMEAVPDLVFLNCCHLGAIDPPNYARFAASISTELMRLGVRAVIAAGWQVDDAAAAKFATAFYDRLLAGESFGDAVAHARRQAYRAGRRSSTWGAYQCYGDPGWRLPVPREPLIEIDPNPVAPAELRRQLGRLAERAEARWPHLPDELLDTLLELHETTADTGWHDEAAVAAAFGQCFAELGQFGPAVYWFRRSLAASVAEATLAVPEQLSEMEVAFASRLHRGAEADLSSLVTVPGPSHLLPAGAERNAVVARDRALEDDLRRAEQDHDALARVLLVTAEHRLHALLSLGETAERHRLLGELHKERAVTGDPVHRPAAARAAAQHYASAHAAQQSPDLDLHARVMAYVADPDPAHTDWLASSCALALVAASPRERAAAVGHLEELERLLAAADGAVLRRIREGVADAHEEAVT